MEQSDFHLLQTVPGYHLQSIVKTRQAVLSDTDKHADGEPDLSSLNLTDLAEQLFRHTVCRELVRSLGPAETAILRELVDCGGRANSRDLALYLASANILQSDSSPHEQEKSSEATFQPSIKPLSARSMTTPSLYPIPHPHGAFEQALHHLLLLGMLFWGKQTNFVGRDYASGIYDGVLIVPQAVIEAAFQEWTLDEKSSPNALLPGEIPGESGHSLQRALYIYWSLVAAMRGGLPLVHSHLLSRTSLRQVLERLIPLGGFFQGLSMDQVRTETDVPYLLFLRLLLIKLGLLVEKRNMLCSVPAKDFFALPLAERAWRCFHLWEETPFWNETAFIPDLIIRPGPGPLDPAHEEVVRSRQMVVEQIAQYEPHIWYSLTAFVAQMKLRLPYLLFPRQYGARAERYSMGSNPYGWDFRLRKGWLTHREGWHMVEGGFIRTLLHGPLSWLGLVELDAEEHPDSFRLLSGATLLTDTTEPHYDDPPWGRLITQPNFDLIALAPVSEALLLDMDRFAERVRLEHIAQYRLNKASVTRAIQLGMTAEAIKQSLEQAGGGDIPQNVHYSLIEWERQVRRVEIWRGTTLLEVADTTLLDKLLQDQEAGEWLRRLSPTLAEVATQHLTQLQELLWQNDYLAGVASASQHQSLLTQTDFPTNESQWELLPTGLLRPCYPLSNLYLTIELERITELDKETGWRKLTPASLQLALSNDLTLSSILSFLQHYCSGGIPGSFLIRLKLWGNGYTDSPAFQIENAPLLGLSTQALRDVLSDEEIAPLLGEPLPAEKRFIHVTPNHLKRVIELLNERGFDINEN